MQRQRGLNDEDQLYKCGSIEYLWWQEVSTIVVMTLIHDVTAHVMLEHPMSMHNTYHPSMVKTPQRSNALSQLVLFLIIIIVIIDPMVNLVHQH